MLTDCIVKRADLVLILRVHLLVVVLPEIHKNYVFV
jgi:hypothetical protein